MTTKTKNDIFKSDYILPSNKSESERLEAQAILYGGVDFLEAAIAARPTAILDVGCGTGYFSRHMARSLPGSEVVGMDQEGSRLAMAQRLGNDLSNLSYCPGNIASMPFEANRFDLVFCRFVLVHTQDISGDLAEMIRVTNPGGRVLAYDMVHNCIWFSPEKKAFNLLLNTVLSKMREMGMEPNQGLHLGTSMMRAGLTEVKSEAVVHHCFATDPIYEVYRDNWIKTIEGFNEILGSKFDRSAVDQAIGELNDDRPEQGLFEMTVLCSGKKGDGL